MKKLYADFKDSGFAIIGVSLDADSATLTKFVADENIAWPQICDGKAWRGPRVHAYGVEGIPATFLIDRDGRIDSMDLRGDALRKRVTELTSAKKPE